MKGSDGFVVRVVLVERGSCDTQSAAMVVHCAAPVAVEAVAAVVEAFPASAFAAELVGQPYDMAPEDEGTAKVGRPGEVESARALEIEASREVQIYLVVLELVGQRRCGRLHLRMRAVVEELLEASATC
jgi:hypothetical protein